MAINLTKGQRVDIGLSKIGVGLGWDPAESGSDFDLDASAFMLDNNGQIPAEGFLLFYGTQGGADGRRYSQDRALIHSGDDQTGGNSEGDDETITVELRLVEPQIEQIVFVVTIYEAEARKQNFGQVRNSFIRIYDATNGSEICKYELGEDFSVETAVELGRLYKRGGAWRFEAMGVGHKGGLATFIGKYAKKFS